MAMAELKRAETGVMVPPEDRVALTFFEGIDFKLRAKGAMAGDNTVRQRINELSADLHGRGAFFSAHAKEYLRCFQPVAGVEFTDTTDVPTLFDQLNPTLEQFDKDQQREVLEYLVHDVTQSIVEKHQPRPAKTGRSDVADATRRVASRFLGKLEDVIMERLEPTPVAGQTQFDRFVRVGKAAALIYLMLKLPSCKPPPTISLDSTPPAITQTVPAIPAMTETLAPPATATLEPTQTETATPTETPVPEVYDWNFVSQRSDEEIFHIIGIPNPADYSLTEEISPSKILRNEGGQSYALFQNSEGIVLLAENLETKVVEHAVYAEYEGGVPLLLLTDQSVVEKDGGWFTLNESYPASDARDRLAKAFNRALSFGWWSSIHPKDSVTFRVYSLDEIPGFHVSDITLLTREERRHISNVILQNFMDALQTARTENSPILLNFPDRNRAQFDATKDTLIIKTVIPDSNPPIWQEVLNGMYAGTIARNVRSERNGTFMTLAVEQIAFMPSREPLRPVGGTITTFLRYFFSGKYYDMQFTDPELKGQCDLTGPILEDVCPDGSLPDSITNFYSSVYPVTDSNRITIPTNTCSVIFGK